MRKRRAFAAPKSSAVAKVSPDQSEIRPNRASGNSHPGAVLTIRSRSRCRCVATPLLGVKYSGSALRFALTEAHSVIPAKAGTHGNPNMDSGFRRNDTELHGFDGGHYYPDLSEP